jgi:hypothetical protein
MVDAGDRGIDGDSVDAPLRSGGASDGIASAEEEAGDPDGVVSGAGLVAESQAATKTVTTIFVATRASEERIRCPPDGVYQKDTRRHPAALQRTCRRADTHVD